MMALIPAANTELANIAAVELQEEKLRLIDDKISYHEKHVIGLKAERVTARSSGTQDTRQEVQHEVRNGCA